MKKEVEIIEIEWDGPLTMTDVSKLDQAWDCGLYQIYGTHNIFGPDSLLYIGKAPESFARRIPEHIEWTDWESVPVRIFVGRLGGSAKVDDKTWTRMIDVAERLLIYYSAPPYNSQNLKSFGNIRSTLVLNHKCCQRLPRVVTSLENESVIGSNEWKIYGK